MRVWKLEGVTLVGVVVEVVCPQDLILKVSGQYLNFWLSYKASLIKWLTCQSRVQRESRESTVVIIMVALPKAWVGQEAGVGQGLPNGNLCTELKENVCFFFLFFC